jgi:acyl carrier protein
MDRLFVVQDVFRQVFDDDTLTIAADTSRGDVADWDSVAHVKIILSLEEEFAVRFSEDEVSSIQTVGDLLTAIENHNRHEA